VANDCLSVAVASFNTNNGIILWLKFQLDWMSVAVAERFEGLQSSRIYALCVLARCLVYFRLCTEIIKLFDAFNKNFRCYLCLNNLWMFCFYSL
jgi:hypothetical protein